MPNPGAELSAKNYRAYQYYRQCLVDQTGLLPRDLLVVRNNSICRQVEESAAQSRGMGALAGLIGLIGVAR